MTIIGSFINQGQVTIEHPVAVDNGLFQGIVTVGAFSYFSHDCEIGHCDIGRYCSIGQRVIIAPGEHPIEFLSTHPFTHAPKGLSAGMGGVEAYRSISCTKTSQPAKPNKRVKIGHDVWIGANAIVKLNVTINSGAIVAAGAVVTKDVEPYAIVAGVPAKQIRWRFPAEIRSRLLDLQWWNYDLASLGPKRDYSNTEAIMARLEALKSRGELLPFRPTMSTIP